METIQNPARLERYLAEYHIADNFTNFDAYQPHFQLVRFHANDLIYLRQESISQVYFFISGKLKVCANLSNGQSLLLCFYNSFEFLGDLELFEMANPSNSIQAITDSLCIALNVMEIKQKLFTDVKFLNFISKSLARKLTKSAANSAINVLYPLEKKLASYIFVVGKRKQAADEKSLIIFDENLKLTSELLGTSYRHLHRVLHQFLNDRILSRGPHGYYVENEAALKELASDLYL